MNVVDEVGGLGHSALEVIRHHKRGMREFHVPRAEEAGFTESGRPCPDLTLFVDGDLVAGTYACRSAAMLVDAHQVQHQ